MIPPKRARVGDPGNKVGMYAVMRYQENAKRAHFVACHESYETASGEAVRLLTDSLQKLPDAQHTYFVLEFAGQFGAGPQGLLSHER